jgi:hypothetical protein
MVFPLAPFGERGRGKGVNDARAVDRASTPSPALSRQRERE